MRLKIIIASCVLFFVWLVTLANWHTFTSYDTPITDSADTGVIDAGDEWVFRRGYGWIPSSCNHQIPLGSRIDADGGVHLADGGYISPVTPCQYLVDRAQGKHVPLHIGSFGLGPPGDNAGNALCYNINAVDNNGHTYVEDDVQGIDGATQSEAFSAFAWIEQFTVSFVLPPNPTDPTSNIELWPGIELTGTGNSQVMQPLISDHFDNIGWNIRLEYCCEAFGYATPEQGPFAVGATVALNMYRDHTQGCTGNDAGLGCYWVQSLSVNGAAVGTNYTIFYTPPTFTVSATYPNFTNAVTWCFEFPSAPCMTADAGCWPGGHGNSMTVSFDTVYQAQNPYSSTQTNAIVGPYSADTTHFLNYYVQDGGPFGIIPPLLISKTPSPAFMPYVEWYSNGGCLATPGASPCTVVPAGKTVTFSW